MKAWWSVAVAACVGAATVLAGYAFTESGIAGAGTPRVLGPGLVTVNVGIAYSRFSIDEVHVHPGTTVRFVITNRDPIHHEFIVGPPSVHARHERGHESAHPPVPGEVSVAPEDNGETFYRFDRTGRFVFACHLPGHFAYGMHGVVVVE
jgi:uncharacterized cupredoxin-like copper-binding protein